MALSEEELRKLYARRSIEELRALRSGTKPIAARAREIIAEELARRGVTTGADGSPAPGDAPPGGAEQAERIAAAFRHVDETYERHADRARYENLARASWMSSGGAAALFVLVELVVKLDARSTANMVFGLAGKFLMLMGIGSGIAALIAVRKHGRKGILVPAIVGIGIAVGLIAAIVLAIIFLAPSPPVLYYRGHP
jgi:hypothetical protein